MKFLHRVFCFQKAVVVFEQVLPDLRLDTLLPIFQLHYRSLQLFLVLLGDYLCVVSFRFERRHSELSDEWVLRFDYLNDGLALGLCFAGLLVPAFAFVGSLGFVLDFSHF